MLIAPKGRAATIAAAAIALSSSAIVAGVAQPGSLESMGVLPNGGGFSVAYGVNGDGSVVVGGGNVTGGDRAIRWTRSGGPVEVPGSTDTAFCVSADGRRTATRGRLFTVDAPPIDFGVAEPTALSADGSIMTAITGPGNLYRVGQGWTTLPGLGVGLDISPDGQWALGYTGSTMTRWSQSTGTQVIGPGRAGSISADGQIICGDLNNHVMRWQQGLGFTDLGTFADVRSLVTTGMSDDGRVIVGSASIRPPGSNSRPVPFIWTEQTGLVSIRSFLVSQGISVAGWSLLDATEISGDGRTIVGLGINPDSQFTGFIAHVPTLPTPTAGAVFALAAWTGLARRRRGRIHA